MEMVQGARKASKLAQEDVISSMPDNVMTKIMDLLPIQYAMRTSILSRNWRFKWTLLSKLVFDEKFFEYLIGPEAGVNFFDRRNISRLLLLLNRVITKFVLYIPNYNMLDVEDINHWVLFLSRIGIKELTLINTHEHYLLKLPTHLSACLELKHLKLQNCIFHFSPSFFSFPHLLSLDLYAVRFENYRCGELIAQCPVLEILKIYDHEPRGAVKPVDIAKLDNLRILNLSLCVLDDMMMIKGSTIFQHICILSKLQELRLDFRKYKFLAESCLTKRFSTTFPCLKILALHRIDFSSETMLSCAFGMIFGSPNLQTLKITATYKKDIRPRDICSSKVDYSTVGLQLRNVVLASIRGLENEVCLIKFLLVCSPLLKKIVIYPDSSLVLDGGNGMFKFASKLLKLHRASPTAEIVLYPF